MISAPCFDGLTGLVHGFGLRSSSYPEGIVTAKQIHSAVVQNAEGPLTDGDALISDRPGVIVGVRTADCVPVLLVDPFKKAVAAIHAGWRGTAARVVEAGVQAMQERFGTKPADVIAAIGPSIGVCCYEVGPEVARQFGIDVSNPVHLDLPQINEEQLRGSGVGKIWKSNECTFCAAERFFSFRREREQAGRMMSFVGWQPVG